MDKSLTDITGIGPRHVEGLKDVGIETIDDLYIHTRTPQAKRKLREKTGIRTRTIDHCEKVADLSRIDFISIKFAEFLIKKGIDSPEELAVQTEVEIEEIINEAAEELPGTCIPPKDKVKKLIDDIADKAKLPCSEDWFEKLEKMRRNNFFQGKLMTARDACAEQEYGRRNDALERRTLVGTGIVYGLGVHFVDKDDKSTNKVVIKKPDDKFSVTVNKGLAIDPFGRFIVVQEKTKIELELPPKSGNDSKSLYLYIFYAEEFDEWVPWFVRGKPCGDMLEHNMIVEGYDLLSFPDNNKTSESVIAEPGKNFTDPKYKCVLIAELTVKETESGWVIENVSGQPDSKVPPRVYSNPKLYELIKKYPGGANGGVQKINEAKPDDKGKILLSPDGGDGIIIEQSGKSNELLFKIKPEYVNEILIDKPDGEAVITGIGNRVKFTTGKGIDIKRATQSRKSNELIFKIEPEYVNKISFDGPEGEMTISGNDNQVKFKAGKGIKIKKETQNRLSITVDESALARGIQKVNDVLPNNAGKIGLTSKDIKIGKSGTAVTLSLDTKKEPFKSIYGELGRLDTNIGSIEGKIDHKVDYSYLADRIEEIKRGQLIPDNPPWEREFEGYDNRLKVIEGDIEAISKTELPGLKDRIKTWDKKIAAYENQFTGIRTEIDAISKEVIPGLSAKVTPMGATITELSNKLDEINNNIVRVSEDYRTTRDELTNNVNDINSKVTMVSENFADFKTETVAINKKLLKASKANETGITRLNDLTKEITIDDLKRLKELEPR